MIRGDLGSRNNGQGLPISTESGPLPKYIDAPRHPNLKFLLDYWTAKRAGRALPSRDDIRPAEIKSVISDVMMWNVPRKGEPYTIRLVGDNIVAFVGRNNTGLPATIGMPDDIAAIMNAVLDRVVETRAPCFRTGKALWVVEKAYREFEACYLPLSSDGQTVDLIFGGVTFDTAPKI